MRFYLTLSIFCLLIACDAPSKLDPIKDAVGAIPSNKARITIYRPESGIFRTPDVTVNGKGKALNDNNSFTIDVKPGTIEVACESWDGGDAKATLVVEKSDHYYMRMRDKGSWFEFDPVSEKVARAEIAAME